MVSSLLSLGTSDTGAGKYSSTAQPSGRSVRCWEVALSRLWARGTYAASGTGIVPSSTRTSVCAGFLRRPLPSKRGPSALALFFHPGYAFPPGPGVRFPPGSSPCKGLPRRPRPSVRGPTARASMSPSTVDGASTWCAPLRALSPLARPAPLGALALPAYGCLSLAVLCDVVTALSCVLASAGLWDVVAALPSAFDFRLLRLTETIEGLCLGFTG